MEFGLLGSVEAWQHGRPVALGGRRARSVLAVLLLEPGRVVPIEHLIERVWGDGAPASARAGAHVQVSRLRRVLPDTIVSTGPGYLAMVDPESVDLHRFRRLVAAALASTDQAEIAAGLTEALRCWRGPALDGAATPWLRDYVCAGLEEERLNAVETRIAAELRMGRAGQPIAELSGLVVQHPLRERLRWLLMSALHQTGRRAEALAAFQDARRVFAEELGVEPDRTLRDLHEQILRDEPERPPPTPPASPVELNRNDLPRDIPDFTGRAGELASLVALLHGAAGDAATDAAATICVISGLAGVGKTTLAVRAARQAAEHYPDAQLYLDLRAHHSGQAPLAAGPALGALLRAVGVAAEQIPDSEPERAALWRSVLNGRRVLLVLDDAVSAAQVRPLLPGGSECVVLVTSRRELAGLDGARTLTLTTLPADDARSLFTRIVGAERVTAEPDHLGEIVELCGFLPLAVRIAAARLRHRPAWAVGDLAARLRDQQRRLAELAVDDRSVATSFALSYHALSAGQQRMFRLLGLVPGGTVDLNAAAALTGLPTAGADRLLEDLVDVHLLEQHRPGRFRFHALLRSYAADRAASEESEKDRRAALHRLLDWYLHTAFAADRQFGLPRRPLELARPQPDTRPLSFASQREAMDWCDAERANAVAAARYAVEHGWPGHAWQIPWALWGYFFLRKYWDEWVDTHVAALAATRLLQDRDAEARTLNDLGLAYQDLHRGREAIDHHQRAFALYTELGDQHGQAVSLTSLGLADARLGQFEQALAYHQRAFALYTELGQHRSAGFSLNSMGMACSGLGRHDQAIGYCEQALAVMRERRDRHCEGDTLNNLAVACSGLGQHSQAVAHGEQALAICRELGNGHGAAGTLRTLGIVFSHTGQPERARACWQQALAVFEELGDPQAAAVLAHLASLDQITAGR